MRVKEVIFFALGNTN